MLQVPNLDDQTYEDLLSEARNVITSTYPAWTNFNEHDPGTTIVELFAMLVENQQFYLDQIGRENRLKYLKLMGVRRRPKCPSETRVHVEADEDCLISEGEGMMAGDLVFETTRQGVILAEDVRGAIAVEDGKVVDAVWLSGRRNDRIGFYPFGATPKEENGCVFVFGRMLPAGVELSLYVDILEDEVVRNPMGDTYFEPFVTIAFEYYGEAGWTPVSCLSDGTCAFLYDGFVRFRIDEEPKSASLYGQEGWFVRARVVRGGYDVAPRFSYISANVIEARQRETVCEMGTYARADVACLSGGFEIPIHTALSVYGDTEAYAGRDGLLTPVEGFGKRFDEKTGGFLFHADMDWDDKMDAFVLVNRRDDGMTRSVIGEGDGFPGQWFDLEDPCVCEEPFTLLIEDEEGRGGYRIWNRVDDFAGSKPEDRHFVLDSEAGRVVFGDGKNGRMPEGEIRIAAYARTMGSGGNVRKHRVERFTMPDLAGMLVTNITEGVGGEDEESLSQAFLRARKLLDAPLTAVTAEDYEALARRAAGLMILDAKVIDASDVRRFRKNAEEGAVHLVIEPCGYDGNREMERIYEANLLHFIEPYRMLGTRVCVYFPSYVDVDVYADVVVTATFLDVEERVAALIRDFFAERREGFGEGVVYSSLYGFLRRQSFISHVRSITLSSKGLAAYYNQLGDLLIPPHAKVRLGRVKIVFSVG